MKKKMRIMIIGASGLIGSALVDVLKSSHQLVLVGRSTVKLQRQFGGGLELLSIDELSKDKIIGTQIVINLAGENIGAKRWAEQQKLKILNSRIETTEKLVSLCLALGEEAPKIINASAIGVYGLAANNQLQNETIYDEDSRLSAPHDFLSEVGQRWEAALLPADNAGLSVIKCRFGVVLSNTGGALAKMLPSFKFGFGAVLGNGEQPMSWVMLTDVISALVFLIEQPSVVGAVNIVAEQVVNQRQFADILAKALNRPRLLTLNNSLIKLLFGQMGEELLLNGQTVKAKRLQELGFNFQYNTLSNGLASLFKPS